MSKKINWKDWEKHCREIDASTFIDAEEPLHVIMERRQRCIDDYAYFVEYCFPKFAKDKCAWYHIFAAYAIANNERIRFLAEWYRGAAKSTHFLLFIPLWLAIRGERIVMLLVGKSETAAIRLLGALQAQLQYNQRFKQLFGEWFNSGNWAEGEFVTKNGHAFYALGLGQSPRGTRNEGDRPTYIAVSDSDSKKLSKNPKLVNEAVEWIQEDLIPTTDKGAARFILENNRFAKHSIMGTFIEQKLASGEPLKAKDIIPNCGSQYREGVKRGGWEGAQRNNYLHLKVNAVNDAGEPTWGEKYTQEYWEEVKADSTMKGWMREYMNNPITEGKNFKNEWMNFVKPLPYRKYDHLLVYIDTSYKATATSDYKAMLLLGKTGRKIHVLKAWVRRASVPQLARAMYDIAETLKDVSVQYFIEANFIQDMQLTQIDEEGDLRGWYVPIVGDKRSKPDKLSRIIAMAGFFERGFIEFNEDEKGSEDMQRLIEQLLAIEEGSNTPDDAPDALEGGLWLLNKKDAASNFNIRIGGHTKSNAY